MVVGGTGLRESVTRWEREVGSQVWGQACCGVGVEGEDPRERRPALQSPRRAGGGGPGCLDKETL